ncbi:MAG: hydrogenase [Acidobacteria bacterium]|nr:hydrogenase [Acidobacteriota bacterium]
MSLGLILTAIILWSVSGVPGCFFQRTSPAGQRLSVGLSLLGSMVGLVGAAIAFQPHGATCNSLSWNLPIGSVSVSVDALSAAFLIPIFLISSIGAVYGLAYWKQSEHPTNGRKLRLFYGLMTASMALLVIAHDGIFFLMAWEGMALSAFFLVTTEDEKPEVQTAGWIYFVATHLSTLLLIGFFALLGSVRGSFALDPILPGSISPTVANVLFGLALAGFGIKAGLFPLHIWLPSAHANAPSHVSAFLSGVLIKMGVYGIIRVAWLFPQPPLWWGSLVLILGVISGILGVAFALGQHDLKRLLAYHSIENIGIIFIGFGLALVGRAMNQPDWTTLGLAGAILHVWNHGLFKALLFLAAGSVIHATHTREIDHLGGLANQMPKTALCFLVGAVAICGLPPLNGFVSELLIYLGLFKVLISPNSATWGVATVAIPALALIGALAVACFVKVYGVVFLGESRSPECQSAHESSPLILNPMSVLVGLCFLIGMIPFLVAPLLQTVIQSWSAPATSTTLSQLAPLEWLSGAGIFLAAGFLLGGWFLVRRIPRSIGTPIGTWDCGYTAPSSTMQYTASSFAQILVLLLSWALFPKVPRLEITDAFPRPVTFHSRVPDTVLDRGLLPAFQQLAQAAVRLQALQDGHTQTYIFYIFIVLLILLILK